MVTNKQGQGKRRANGDAFCLRVKTDYIEPLLEKNNLENLFRVQTNYSPPPIVTRYGGYWKRSLDIAILSRDGLIAWIETKRSCRERHRLAAYDADVFRYTFCEVCPLMMFVYESECPGLGIDRVTADYARRCKELGSIFDAVASTMLPDTMVSLQKIILERLTTIKTVTSNGIFGDQMALFGV